MTDKTEKDTIIPFRKSYLQHLTNGIAALHEDINMLRTLVTTTANSLLKLDQGCSAMYELVTQQQDRIASLEAQLTKLQGTDK